MHGYSIRVYYCIMIHIILASIQLQKLKLTCQMMCVSPGLQFLAFHTSAQNERVRQFLFAGKTSRGAGGGLSLLQD